MLKLLHRGRSAAFRSEHTDEDIPQMVLPRQREYDQVAPASERSRIGRVVRVLRVKDEAQINVGFEDRAPDTQETSRNGQDTETDRRSAASYQESQK